MSIMCRSAISEGGLFVHGGVQPQFPEPPHPTPPHSHLQKGPQKLP